MQCFVSWLPVAYWCNCPERLVSEMTYHVSSGTLNPTHSVTHSKTDLVTLTMFVYTTTTLARDHR